jgi:hypothetical protein
MKFALCSVGEEVAASDSALIGGQLQGDAAMNSPLEEKRFNQLPDMRPLSLQATVQIAELVSKHGEAVASTSGFAKMRKAKLRDFVSRQSTGSVKAGRQVSPPINAQTRADAAGILLVRPEADVWAYGVSCWPGKDGSMPDSRDSLEFEMRNELDGSLLNL